MNSFFTCACRKLLRLYLKKRSRRMVAMLASATALFTGGWFVASNAEISLLVIQ